MNSNGRTSKLAANILTYPWHDPEGIKTELLNKRLVTQMKKIITDYFHDVI